MGFNYASEKRRFIAEWNILAEQYREAGLDEAGIQTMREFDWEWFKQRRTYGNRNQALPSEVIDNNDDESRSTLFRKFASLSVSFDEGEFIDRFGWIDAVSDSVLSDKLYMLSESDKELLTLVAIDGYSQSEIAVLQGCVPSERGWRELSCVMEVTTHCLPLCVRVLRKIGHNKQNKNDSTVNYLQL